MFSESQFKLAALIVKTKEVVALASDSACQETFELVARFCQDVTVQSQGRPAIEQGFAEMSLEALLNLPTPKRA